MIVTKVFLTHTSQAKISAGFSKAALWFWRAASIRTVNGKIPKRVGLRSLICGPVGALSLLTQTPVTEFFAFMLWETPGASRLEPTTSQQIVEESSFLNFMEIDVKQVLTTVYNNWPRIKQVPEKPQTGNFRARALSLGV